MKRFLTLCVVTLAFLSTHAQVTVTWTATYKPGSDKEALISIHADIANGWHMYSQTPTDDGPVPTTFTFPVTTFYELSGKTTESEAHEEFDKAFGVKIRSFEHKADFSQPVKLKGAKSGDLISFKVEFMTCNDMTCLPPKTVELSVRIP